MREAKQFLLDNPELFLLYYFPDALRPDYDKEGTLEPFHLDLIRMIQSETRALILEPAGHGKTTIVSTLLPIWRLCKWPNIRQAIIAKNEQDAKGIMRTIHSELLGNEKLIRDFGSFYPEDDSAKAWAIERIDIKQKTRFTKEGSVMIYGSKGNVLGKRFDYVVCDDVVTEKNSATPEQRQGMLDWFNLGVETMPEHPNSQLHVVGTLFDPEDLYNTLRDLRYPESQEKIYTEVRVDAIVDEEKKITLWPERWTWDRLMGQKAKMGTLDFNKRYRNIAVDKSRIIFLHEYLYGGYIGKNKYPGCLDESFAIGDFLDNWRMIAGFDPALGVSKIAKFCAHIVIGVGSCVRHDKCYWVVDLERDQYTMPQQVDMLIDKHQHYDLWATVIEVNGYQVGLEQAMRLRMEENGLALNVMPHHTSRNNKPDPEIGVSGMQGMIENGMLHIPWADPHSRRVMQQFLDELEMYPAGKTTDTVMALWFAWKTAQDASPRYASYNRLEVPTKSMFVDKGGRRVIRNPAYT